MIELLFNVIPHLITYESSKLGSWNRDFQERKFGPNVDYIKSRFLDQVDKYIQQQEERWSRGWVTLTTEGGGEVLPFQPKKGACTFLENAMAC